MSAVMEETKVPVIVKPEAHGSQTNLHQNRGQGNNNNKGDRNDRSHRNDRGGGGNSGNSSRRDGQGSFGGRNRGGGGNRGSGDYRRGAGGSGRPRDGSTDKFQQRKQHNDDNASGQQQQHMGVSRNMERFLYDKLKEIGGPTHELPPLDVVEKKFSGRCRLYLGNIPPNLDESEIKDMLKEYGEVSEVFLNREKRFSFVRLDHHYNAEKAKNELNGKMIKNHTIKVRFAPHGATIKVKNLEEHVSNELLQLGFACFGDVDRAVVSLDDRGKPIGEGIVEFARKNSSLLAIRKCSEGCFFLTHSIRPVLVEAYETSDDQDGHSDRFINRNNPEYQKSRSVGPRFAHANSFELEFGMRWKELYEMHKRKQETLDKDLQIEMNKLIAQMEFSRYEHETAMLREELRAREMDMDRQKRQWEQKQSQAEDERRNVEDRMRHRQGGMGVRGMGGGVLQQQLQLQLQQVQQGNDREQQENSLFMQAQQLTNMLECQEKSYFVAAGPGGDMQAIGGVVRDAAGDAKSDKNNYSSLGKRRRY